MTDKQTANPASISDPKSLMVREAVLCRGAKYNPYHLHAVSAELKTASTFSRQRIPPLYTLKQVPNGPAYPLNLPTEALLEARPTDRGEIEGRDAESRGVIADDDDRAGGVNSEGMTIAARRRIVGNGDPHYGLEGASTHLRDADIAADAVGGQFAAIRHQGDLGALARMNVRVIYSTEAFTDKIGKVGTQTERSFRSLGTREPVGSIDQFVNDLYVQQGLLRR